MAGSALLAAAVPHPAAQAQPSRLDRPGARRPPPTAPFDSGALLFADEFDGPPGSAPDPTKWTVARFRQQIAHPAFWDRPENLGQYRDDRRNVFLD
ncbi:MAG TPA: 1,3-beta-glucanase, partial [Mycobacterium sp.]|nr:1,3-beta-glucanase [Mycobacterium sp.]